MDVQSVFSSAEILPSPFIFDLSARFRADAHPKKLDLGIGVYRDEALQSAVFSAVRKAEALVVADSRDKEYLPVLGLAELRTASSRLVFGPDAEAVYEGRVATAHCLSGTGSLTVAAHLAKRLLPGRRVFCSDPTWATHENVIADAGLGQLESYRYWDAASRSLDEAGLLADLEAMPKGSLVLLHAVAHNPTGVSTRPASSGAA